MPVPAPHPPAAPSPLTDRQRQALLRLCAVLRAIAARHDQVAHPAPATPAGPKREVATRDGVLDPAGAADPLPR